jgi:hypothetical protein
LPLGQPSVDMWSPRQDSNPHGPEVEARRSVRLSYEGELVETAGNAPATTILQGSSAPLCCPPKSQQPSFAKASEGILLRAQSCEARYARSGMEWRTGLEPASTRFAIAAVTSSGHRHHKLGSRSRTRTCIATFRALHPAVRRSWKLVPTRNLPGVMAGLVPAIHVLRKKGVDARHSRQVYAVCASLTACRA